MLRRRLSFSFSTSWGMGAQAILKKERGILLAIQWLRLHLPVWEVQVWSPVREPGSCMPHSPKKPTHKQKPEHKQQKQHCNKFNKDFKNGPHQTKQSKKRERVILKTGTFETSGRQQHWVSDSEKTPRNLSTSTPGLPQRLLYAACTPLAWCLFLLCSIWAEASLSTLTSGVRFLAKS